VSARERLRAAGRLAALAATALVLMATSVAPCIGKDRGTFDAATSCGPPGAITLSYSGAYSSAGCGGGDCWAMVEAPEANAVGLPEQGEIHPSTDQAPKYDPELGTTAAPGKVFVTYPFALVGDAPVAGAAPPATVRRICRATPSATAGAVDLTCEGAGAVPPCSGTLTLVPGAP
jgi:hypothetical protein